MSIQSKVVTSLQIGVEEIAKDESGEVTVAWVLVTAGLVALSITVLSLIGGGTQVLAANIDTELSERTFPNFN